MNTLVAVADENMAAVDMKDTILLHEDRKLFLKSISRMIIIVQLPEMKLPGSSISNWEVMEKLKMLICPNVFSYLKVSKTTTDFLHFEAETESKEMLSRLILKLDATSIKLSGFSEPLKVKAGKAKVKFPKKHDWVAYFRDAKIVDETKPGERPDTIHIEGLPFKWFAAGGKTLPCEDTIYDIFSKYGCLRAIDIPVLDPYRNRMNNSACSSETGFKTFSFGSSLYFEIYVQYQDYTGFEKVMQAFKGKKLVHLLEDGKVAAVNLIVDFDKTAHLSESNVKKRNILRQKLINDDLLQAEIARKHEEEEKYRRELEILEELQKEEKRKRDIEIEKQKTELEKEIKETKRKIKKINKFIIIHERRRQEELNNEKKLKLTEMRKNQAMNLMIDILKRLKKQRMQERKEEIRRKKEIKILHKLKEKNLENERQKIHRMQEEKEKRHQLKKKERELRKRLLKKFQETKEIKNEQQRDLDKKISVKEDIIFHPVVCEHTNND